MALDPTANGDDRPVSTGDPEGEPTVSSNSRGRAALARGSSLVTTLIKVGGLVIAGNEALFTKPPRDAVVFAVAAFMMAGAQGLENIIDNFLGSGKGSQ